MDQSPLSSDRVCYEALRRADRGDFKGALQVGERAGAEGSYPRLWFINRVLQVYSRCGT
jgi:hypothetical protein